MQHVAQTAAASFPNVSPPEKVRVSVLERLLPYASVAVALAASLVGAFFLYNVFRALKESENAGIAAVAGGVSEAHVAPAILFGLAAVVSFLALVVAVVRMFVPSKTSSPSGASYFIFALLSLVPAGMIWYIGFLVKNIIERLDAAYSEAAWSQIDYFLIAIPIVSVVVFLMSLPFAFAPFRSKPGRRFGPAIGLLLMLITFAACTAVFTFRIFEFATIRDLH